MISLYSVSGEDSDTKIQLGFPQSCFAAYSLSTKNIYHISGKEKTWVIQSKLRKPRGFFSAAIPDASLFYSQVQSVHPGLNYRMITTATCPLLHTGETEQSEHRGCSSVPTVVKEGCLGLPTLSVKHGPKPTLKPRLAHILSTLAGSQA